ncbi:D-inositol-3-phosphate glycosyltransferase [Rhodoferax lithotrophicus]|uniref:D-inositol-3-phosphate glycosyltransferase n=2 Tax=Rhodoferax lithotrophicus TaxID=2798804 RepID=A0ABN6DC33_9BURK|nr:D-inositol-3-phosphate glycosyltransferase [Rhodoferax sp. MIZ03]
MNWCKLGSTKLLDDTDVMNTSMHLSNIRIARISTVPFFVVAQLKHQLVELGLQGAQVTVIASDEPEMSLLRGLTGVRCMPIDIPRSISPWRDFKGLIHLYRFFMREHTQIAHSTTPKAGLLTALAAFLAGVPVRLHTFTGQPWATMHGLKRWLARTSDKLIGLLNTRCYTDSASQRQYLISQNIVKENKLFVIGTGSLAGVDTQRFDRKRFSSIQCAMLRKELDIPVSAPVVLFVGRITVDKGVHELIQAYAKIKTTGSDAHLVFVGRFDTESGVEGAILPRDIECLPDSHIVGYTDCPEKYFAIANILCLPSYREGFGTVVIEAASMGVPTVGTRIYGLTDAVEDGQTGLLVEPRDADKLADSLLNLLNDTSLRIMMGKAAMQRALALFDAQKVNLLVVNEYLALLRSAGILK